MATGILTSLINSFKRNIDEFQCICGSVLQKEDAQLLYGKSQGAICDICKTDPRSVELWHCPQEYNIFHPDGYDICNNCRFVTELPRQEDSGPIAHCIERTGIHRCHEKSERMKSVCFLNLDQYSND
eukprot:9871_1